MSEQITVEWLKEQGYELDEFVYLKSFGHVEITVGTWPFNEMRVCIRIEGATIATSATTQAELKELERLFGEGIVDHDDFMYVDDEDFGEAE